MQSSIQIMLDAERPRDGLAVCAAVDADLKKLADTFAKSSAGDWPNAAAQSAHYHLRKQVALHLLKAVLQPAIKEEAHDLIETVMKADADVYGGTEDFPMGPEIIGLAESLADAYEKEITPRRRERDRAEGEYLETPHPDRP